MKPINLKPVEGAHEITNTSLRGREVLIVSVAGVQYDVVDTTPTGRQVWPKPDEGKLVFDSNIQFVKNAKAFALTN